MADWELDPLFNELDRDLRGYAGEGGEIICARDANRWQRFKAATGAIFLICPRARSIYSNSF